jgi:phosphoglycolate phosphatase
MSAVSLLSATSAVLFDFDGPLCQVFAGLPAPAIAHDLAGILGADVETDDPLEVLKRSVRFGPEMVRRVEDALISAEITAIDRSLATPGGIESIRACLAADLPVGIVSNNSAGAISAFLAKWGLLNEVTPVVGRTYMHPELMKPHVRPLEMALEDLGCTPADVVFIGDSQTDIEVAAAVGVPCVAYANKPDKRLQFSTTGATLVDNMWEVNAALRTRAVPRRDP